MQRTARPCAHIVGTIKGIKGIGVVPLRHICVDRVVVKGQVARVVLRGSLSKGHCATASSSSTPSTPAGLTKAVEGAPHVAPIASAYVRGEEQVMRKVGIENSTWFRAMMVSFLTAAGGGAWYFWDEIKGLVAGETADIATRSLEGRELQERASHITKEVLTQVMVDQNVKGNTVVFLRALIESPETQTALVDLLLLALRHEATVSQLRAMGADLVGWLAADEKTRNTLIELVRVVLRNPDTRQAVVEIAVGLAADPKVLQALSSLFVEALQKEDFQSEAAKALVQVAHQALEDEGLREHAVAYVLGILADRAIQTQGGDALWKAVTHAFSPGWLRSKSSKVPVADGVPSGEEDTSTHAPELSSSMPTTTSGESSPMPTAPLEESPASLSTDLEAISNSPTPTGSQSSASPSSDTSLTPFPEADLDFTKLAAGPTARSVEE